MCGIAGWLGYLPDGERYALQMVKSLRHRGPDAEGIRSWPAATLVHTRLSIIDLSPTGAQPMANEDGTVWTVFNGEIYNHGELRRDLEARGHVFKGRSDTEVIPHLYEEEGVSCVAKLRGMFALAIFDTRANRLILARDRFGIKPLFYAQRAERLAFASEIGALLELPGIEDRLDRQAIYDFSALLYIPAPETVYEGIRAVEPGQVIEGQVDRDRIVWKTRRYHRWSIAPDREIGLAEASERAEALLVQAVRRQMESDVPLGALLSGGIDSSLVSVAAQEASAEGIKTFNVRFPDEDFDETWAAVEVAKHIDSFHTTLDMESAGGTWDHITGLLRHAGQPFGDTSLFAVHAVCRLMRQHVTVALSGDGGDEGFGGYNTFWQLNRIATVQRIPASVLCGASVGMGYLGKLGIIPKRFGQRLGEMVGADDIAVVQNLFSWVREDEHRRLFVDEKGLLPIRRWFEPQWQYDLPRGTSRLERLSAYATEANIRLRLPNDFLCKVDTASMKESFEVRVPMLDEDLFDFGLSLPHALKVKGRTCKLVLRAIADRRLPPRVARKPKMGFGIPVDTWVDTDFKIRLRETLLGPASRLSEYFEPKMYRPMVEAFCRGNVHPSISRQGLYQRIIMFLSLQIACANTTD